MKTIRESSEYIDIIFWRKTATDALILLRQAIDTFESKFGGVKYEEYKTKEKK